MRLAPTPEQAELKAAVRRFCEEQIDADRLAAWSRLPRGIDDATWRAIADLGWFGLGLPGEVGGSGQGLVEVACLLEECSRGLVPLPVIDAIRGGRALATLDPRAPELNAVARGERVVTLAMGEPGGDHPSHGATRLVTRGASTVVDGEKWFVPDADAADWHIVAARDGEGVALVLIERGQFAVTSLRSFDGQPQAIVCYDNTALTRRLAFSDQAERAIRALQREQQALALAEQIGTIGAVLDMTVAYVKEREQFGQKIAVFQAVQHQVADTGMAYTAARHLAWQAITRLAAGTIEGTELATAAAFVGQTCKRATLTAHHLHGGAGYVIEHPLHFHSERAQTLCIRYTPEGPALAQIAASLLG